MPAAESRGGGRTDAKTVGGSERSQYDVFWSVQNTTLIETRCVEDGWRWDENISFQPISCYVAWKTKRRNGRRPDRLQPRVSLHVVHGWEGTSGRAALLRCFLPCGAARHVPFGGRGCNVRMGRGAFLSSHWNQNRPQDS